jgi:hypothetical protein
MRRSKEDVEQMEISIWSGSKEEKERRLGKMKR